MIAVAMMMVVMMMNIYLEAQDECTNDSSTIPARVMVKHDEVDAGGKSVKKLLKSWKNFKNLKNLQRLLFQNNFYQNTDPPSIRYKKSSFY